MAKDVMTKEKDIIVYLGDDPHVINGLESDVSIESHRFANGIAFKKCLKELDEIDLVLVDQDLKGLNGIRLIQWLKEGQNGRRLYYAQTGGSGVPCNPVLAAHND